MPWLSTNGSTDLLAPVSRLFLSAWGETLNTMIESYVPPGYAAQFISIRQVIFSFPWPLQLCYANKYACVVGPNLNKDLT